MIIPSGSSNTTSILTVLSDFWSVGDGSLAATVTILGKNSDGSLRLYVIGSISLCDPRHNRGMGPGGLGAFLPAAVRNPGKVG
jgi:hypothetical protein